MSNSQSDTCTIHNIRLDHHFTTIPNQTMEDEDLSFLAKGVLCYILTRPQNWSIHLWQLANVYKGKLRGNGLDSIRSAMRELRDKGYVVHLKTRTSEGKWSHKYHVYPLKISHFKKMFPEGVEPALVQPALVKPPILTKTESLLRTEKKNSINKIPIYKEKQQQQHANNKSLKKEKVVVVVSSEIEKKAKELEDFLRKVSISYGESWKMPFKFCLKIIQEYGSKYVGEQLLYMTDQQDQAIKDLKNPFKKRKRPLIDYPERFLMIACEKNYADSEN